MVLPPQHAFPVFKICGFIYWPGFSVESELCLEAEKLIRLA